MKSRLREKAPVGATVEIDPGKGNLSAKAYVAALVGPQRVAFGQRQSFNLTPNQAVRIASNASAAEQVGFVSVTLPANMPGPSVAYFGGTPPGVNDGIPVQLENTYGAPAGTAFTAILSPGEELYARSVSANFQVVVSLNWF